MEVALHSSADRQSSGYWRRNNLVHSSYFQNFPKMETTVNGGNGGAFFNPLMPRVSYSSLPRQLHPPLLPLPTPAPSRRFRSLPGGHQKPQKKGNKEQKVSIKKPAKQAAKKYPEEIPDLCKGKRFGSDPNLFGGSVFPMGPPPSSLPMPRFTLLKAKLNCKVEAANRNGDGMTGISTS